MLKAIRSINNANKNSSELWLTYLYNTLEKNYNYLNVSSLKEITNHSVLNYCLKTLQVLDEINKEEKLAKDILYLVEETLKWSEVAKCGRKSERSLWRKKGYDLYAHNIGSSQIYLETNNNIIISTLIKTHGLVGQFLKGETTLNKNYELYLLIKNKLITKNKLRKVLIVLNKCIISGVSKNLYKDIEPKVIETIDLIINNQFNNQENYITRLEKLNKTLSKEELNYLTRLNNKVKTCLEDLFSKVDIWYFESAIESFSLKEQIKILLIIQKHLTEKIDNVTFEKLMKDLYFNYHQKRELNLYKKRVIEYYLNTISYQDILHNKIKISPHIKTNIKIENNNLIFNFKYSIQIKKLIEFCEVASINDSNYQKAIYMLYDLFGFRKDKFDRFFEETTYLEQMNHSKSDKEKILNYLVGQNILDIGSGGGIILNLLEKHNPNLNITGMDISQNVIEKLKTLKLKENHQWNIFKGDALNLNKYIKNNSQDTIIFSAIIHELYSYITFNGKKFNTETIKVVLTEAYKALRKGGRIIIRDGVMEENKDAYRIIEFYNPKDIEILNRFCHDFQGRNIKYTKLSENKVKLLVNDALEFLYTYTWGEEAYPMEVQEQFAYFTLKEYTKFIKEILPNSKIIVKKEYLQKGYNVNLLSKIAIYDENLNICNLPNSTLLIVIEKS